MITEIFNPAAPESEQIAWAAGLSLTDPPADFDVALPDGSTARQKATETYKAYFEHRQAKGLEPFPTMKVQAAEAMQGEFRKAYSGLDTLKDNLKPEQWQQLELGGAGSQDPQEFHARAINANFFRSMVGREIPPENLSAVRDAYARDQLGLQGEVTDKAVYQAIQSRHQQDDADAKAFSATLQDHIGRRLDTMGKVDTAAPTDMSQTPQGKVPVGWTPPKKSLEWIPTTEDRDKALEAISERNRPAFRAKWNEAQREINRLARKAAPMVEMMAGAVERFQGSDQPDAWTREFIDQWAAKLPDEPKERAMVLSMLGNKLSNLPTDQTEAWRRIGRSASRGMMSAVDYMKIQTVARGRQMVRTLPYGDPNSLDVTSDAARKQESARRELLDVIEGNGLKLSDATDNFFTRSAVAGASSAWMIPAAFHPIGQLAIQSTMAGQSTQTAMLNNPAGQEGLQTNAAEASGMVQAVIETLSNTSGAKIMLGKLPTFTAALNKVGIASPLGRGVLGFAAGAAATTGMEYTEEALQGGTDLLMQGLAADLSGQKPDIDWGKYFTDWATAAGPEQQETLLAVSAFGMIAGAGASFNHFRYGSTLQRNKTFLRANGLSEPEVRDVVSTQDADAASQKAAAYFDLAQARAKDSPEEQARLAELRKEAIAVLKASNEAYAAAGMPRVVKETNDFTGEDQHVFIDPVAGTRKAFENEDDALGAWQDWASAQSEENIAAIREAGEAGFLDYLTAEGSATEGVNVERVNKTVTPATEQAAAEADVKAAESDARKAMTPAQERKARETLDAAKERLGHVKSRVEIFLLERGIDPGNAAAVGRAMNSVVIKAKSFATMLQGRVVGYTVQLFNGAEIQDIAEDFSETAMKMAVEDGFADPEIILDDIRRYEAASGNQVIAPGYEYDPTNRLPLIEGFSKLARGVLMGNVRSGLLPPEVSAWIEMQASLMAVSVDLAKQGDQLSMDVKTAGELRAAIAAGQVPKRLERLLRDSLGLDPEQQQRRLEQRMEEQLAAEAMDGFPEISDVMKGRLPHPETLRENSNPLYGEVRRIWESLKKPTKRRTKEGKTVDRVNEANAYFLPVGEMVDLDNVLQAVNERGFSFDTITDMLDALDVSISYGKPVYGTASVGDESWAMGDAPLTRLRGKNAIKFSNPIETPLGKVIGYEWRSKLIEADSGGPEGMVLKRVSDWDKATTNAETGRDIVHHFTIEKGDGEISTVSLESTLKSAGTSAKDLKSLITAARRLPLREAEMQQLTADIAEYRKRYDAEERRVSSLTPPEPSWQESEWQSVRDRGQANMMVGDVFVSVEDQSKPFPRDRVEYGRSQWKQRQMQIGMETPDFGRVDVLKRLIRKDREKLKSAGVTEENGTPVDLRQGQSSFSIGRASVTPSAETRTFQGAEGSPSVIGPASFAIGAWHGTPHKVDRFSLDKIGTGEGAQAYGWGLYFAQNRGVGEEYARTLGSEGFNILGTFDGKPVRQSDPLPPTDLMDGKDWGVFLRIAQRGEAAAIRSIEELNISEEAKKDGIARVKNLANRVGPPPVGNLYRVELDMEDSDLLDWDGHEHPEKIKGILRGIFGEYGFGGTGSTIYRELSGPIGEQFGGGSPEKAASLLASAGIPGIRYLDGNSRNRPFNDIKRDFLNVLPENAEFDDVQLAINDGAFNQSQVAFLNALKSDDWLGFDYPAQAISAALSDQISNWETSAALVDSIKLLRGQVSYNYVIFDESKIRITEENGTPVSVLTSNSALGTSGGASFAMSTPGLMRLEAAIAKRMTRGPDERAEFFQRLRDRLAATVLQLRETKRNLATDIPDAERERNRIRDAMAEAQAVIKALPMEARGRVPFSVNDILDADTERGQINGIIRLIDKADEALETVLLKEYREAFETLLDLAKPDLRQNKTIRGRLTPETQKLVGKVLEATILTPAELAVKLTAKQAEIDTLEATNPTEPEAIKAAQAELISLYEDQTILETFGAFGNLDAEATARAYEQLQSIYIRGRTARKIVDEARRAELDAAKYELLNTLPEISQAQHAERMAEKGIGDLAENFRLGMSSFHQVMEFLFPRSTVARDFQDRVRKADRGFTRAKLAAKDRFDAFTFGVWNLSGASRNRKRNRILADLSTLRSDWGINLQEGVAFASEKLTEEQAAAIVTGLMKTGWEDDPIAMTSLRQALADFRMQRLKAQNEDKRFTATVIRFQRLTKRGKPGPLVASDLQALYFLQLYAQEQYRPALDKYGFTEEVIQKMEAKMNPKARDLGDFLRDEYDAEWSRMNPVYRSIYGLDMPKIRNYAPGSFEHLDAKGPGTDSTIDPNGAPAGVNAMSAGFTKARTHHMARPVLTNALAKYWSHMEATEYFIHYAELVRDARQVFRNPELRRRIEGIHGAGVAKLFSQWLDAIEVDGNFRAVEMQALAELAHRTLATQSAVGLAFNVGVLFKQASAALGVMLEMPAKQAATGFMRAFRNPAALKAVWNSDAVQQRILAGISPEDRRLLDAGKANPSLMMELLELGRLPIAYADAAFTTLSASVAYAYHHGEAIKAGLSATAAETSALAAASRVIERTAQPATTQDKSMAELTAKGFGKFLFMFKSDPRQKLAIVANALADAKSGRMSKTTAARKLLWGWAIYGLMNELLTDIWAGISRDDDDEDRWAWQDYLAAMVAGPVSAVPLYGQAVEWIARASIGTRGYVNSPNPIDQITRIPATAKKLQQSIAQDGEEFEVGDILTAAQQLSAASAIVVSDPRFAIVPAALRVARDAYGMATNTVGMLTEPTADENRLEIIRSIAEDQKAIRDGKAEATAALVKDLAKLPPADLQQRLARLDADTRATVTRKLRAAQMTASEAALEKLTKENRKAAIERITAGMGAEEKSAYLARLKSLGLD